MHWLSCSVFQRRYSVSCREAEWTLRHFRTSRAKLDRKKAFFRIVAIISDRPFVYFSHGVDRCHPTLGQVAILPGDQLLRWTSATERGEGRYGNIACVGGQ